MAHAGSPAGEGLRALLAGATGALKVFPLPGVVVFPGTPAPFHIFEPRYRAMVADALAGDQLLAVATIQAPEGFEGDRPPLAPVAGAGIIEAHERLADGRFNILLRGLERVRLVEELTGTGRLYREFRVEVLEDRYPPDGPAAVAAQVSTLERIVLELARRRGSEEGTADLAEAVARMRVPARMADAVAAALVGDVAARLAILEEVDVARRLDRVIREVASALLETPGQGGSPFARA